MTGPIKPSEVPSFKKAALPAAVFEAFNELIVEKMSNGRAVITQNQAVHRICLKMDCTRGELFANGWLDVESAYREAGWDVEYDKPGYNETYEAKFTFKEKT